MVWWRIVFVVWFGDEKTINNQVGAGFIARFVHNLELMRKNVDPEC